MNIPCTIRFIVSLCCLISIGPISYAQEAASDDDWNALALKQANLRKIQSILQSSDHPLYGKQAVGTLRSARTLSFNTRDVVFKSVRSAELVNGLLQLLCPTERDCSDLGLSLEFMDETLSRTDEGCVDSVEDFIREQATLRKLLRRKFQASQAVRRALATAKSFDENCLHQVEHLPGESRKAMADSLGIVARGGKIICAAMRIANGLAMTARHCFETSGRFRKSNTKGAVFLLYSIPDKPIQFSVVQNKYYSTRRRTTPDNQDYIFLDLSDSEIERDPPTINFGTAQSLDRLMIAGFHDAAYLYQHFEESLAVSSNSNDDASDSSISVPNPLAKLDWHKGIRFDPWCFATLVTVDGCIHHGCQSTKGMSGAPILRWSDDGRLQLVGLHVSESKPTGECVALSELRAGNLGIIPSRAELTDHGVPGIVPE